MVAEERNRLWNRLIRQLPNKEGWKRGGGGAGGGREWEPSSELRSVVRHLLSALVGMSGSGSTPVSNDLGVQAGSQADSSVIHEGNDPGPLVRLTQNGAHLNVVAATKTFTFLSLYLRSVLTTVLSYE